MTAHASPFPLLVAACQALDPEPIADLATRMLKLWSPPGQEAEMAALAAAALRDAGAQDVSIDPEFPASPSVIAWLRGSEPGPTLQWHGHLDAINNDQGQVRREGNLIFGRGASDMKGALAAEIAAVGLLRAAGLPRRGSVLITFHGLHEEGRSAPLHGLIARGIHGDAAIIGELGGPTELITSSRGLTFWDIVVSRSGDSIHEQNAPADTVHPIRVGHLLLDRLYDLADRLAAGSVQPRGSLFVGKAVGGDYYNRVPTAFEVSGTRRHYADSDLAAVRDQLAGLCADLARETGATIEPRIHSLTEAYEISPEERVARALRRANADVTGNAMTAAQSRATGNAADFVREAGIPAVYYGCDYATAHSDVEKLDIADLKRVAAVYALTTAHFLDGPAEIDAPDLGASA